MRVFSWCPRIPGTLRLDSIFSLFKCEKAILTDLSHGHTLCPFVDGVHLGRREDVHLDEVPDQVDARLVGRADLELFVGRDEGQEFPAETQVTLQQVLLHQVWFFFSGGMAFDFVHC